MQSPIMLGPLHASRPGIAGRFTSAHATSPLGSNLRGHFRHGPDLAPQAGLA